MVTGSQHCPRQFRHFHDCWMPVLSNYRVQLQLSKLSLMDPAAARKPVSRSAMLKFVKLSKILEDVQHDQNV